MASRPLVEQARIDLMLEIDAAKRELAKERGCTFIRLESLKAELLS
jgi:hypothetical protein